MIIQQKVFGLIWECNSPKSNITPEKLPKPKRKVVFQPPFFRGYETLEGYGLVPWRVDLVTIPRTLTPWLDLSVEHGYLVRAASRFIQSTSIVH